jgi:pimeloyl-ACP methyl ester carboxylesterase
VIFEYDFSPHYLPLPAGRLHYLDEGSGPMVLLVHGNPTWSYYYRNLVACLSQNFRVIAPDHLGCGFSDKPRRYEYTLENHITNLCSLLDHLGADRFSMVVHDWGGAIGLGLVEQSGRELEKLVILNTAAFRSSRIPLRISVCRWPVVGRILVQGLNGFARAAIYMAVTKKMDPRVAAGYLKPYDNWQNRRAIHGFVKDIPLRPDHRSYARLVRVEQSLLRLTEKQTPVSILWGGQDFCFNDHFYQEWRLRLPDSEHRYFDGWGHYILEDGRGQIEPIIEEYLSRT